MDWQYCRAPEGQTRPISTTTAVVKTTPQAFLEQRQVPFHRANQDPCFRIFLYYRESVPLLVAKQAEGRRGKHGDG